MVNGIGVVGWGVGGIEAEAAMLGQPVSMLIPAWSASASPGELPEGSTATDLVLTITEMLRQHGVVGKFVEFYGAGRVGSAGRQPSHDRQHEPRVRLHHRGLPDRPADRGVPRPGGAAPTSSSALVEAYAKEQGLWHDPEAEPRYSERLELDLSTVVPSLAGPKRPQDRVEVTEAQDVFRGALADYVDGDRVEEQGYDEAVAESFPASDSPSHANGNGAPSRPSAAPKDGGRPSNPVTVTINGQEAVVDHGAVVIAAITSRTNTSNPSVMIGAALLAKNAVEKGLQRKPWVKTSLAPGSKVVSDYYEKAGLTPYLDKLGFNLVGYGCTTCIGNSWTPHPRGERRGQREGPRRGERAVRQPQLRGPDQPRREDELPRVPAAGGRLRARGLDGRRPLR